jgi:hypothetical protein
MNNPIDPDESIRIGVAPTAMFRRPPKCGLICSIGSDTVGA